MTNPAQTVKVAAGFERHLLPRVWGWIEPHREKLMGDHDPQSVQEFMASWDHPNILANSFTVKVDGELGGVVRFSAVRRGIAEAVAFFPRYTFRQNVLQQGLAEALRSYFAANADLRKVEWRGMLDQSAQVVGALRPIGGRKEATVEHGALQGGRWVKVVQVGILREAVI